MAHTFLLDPMLRNTPGHIRHDPFTHDPSFFFIFFFFFLYLFHRICKLYSVSTNHVFTFWLYWLSSPASHHVVYLLFFFFYYYFFLLPIYLFLSLFFFLFLFLFLSICTLLFFYSPWAWTIKQTTSKKATSWKNHRVVREATTSTTIKGRSEKFEREELGERFVEDDIAGWEELATL